jgi:hypothetical protein
MTEWLSDDWRRTVGQVCDRAMTTRDCPFSHRYGPDGVPVGGPDHRTLWVAERRAQVIRQQLEAERATYPEVNR